MEKENSSKIKLTILVIFLIGLSIGFVLGVYINKLVFNNKTADSANPDGQLIRENSELKAQLESVKKYFPSNPEMLFVTGAVKSASGSLLVIETGINPNPFEQLPTTREITVAPSTKIVKQEYKNPEVLRAENEKYQRKLESGISDAVPPANTIENNIGLSEINANDLITAVSENNIKYSASFEAAKIILLPIN
ncbi:MAG: hypothetical protein AABX32_01565 [Nanoarchaeota archaeon]